MLNLYKTLIQFLVIVVCEAGRMLSLKVSQFECEVGLLRALLLKVKIRGLDTRLKFGPQFLKLPPLLAEGKGLEECDGTDSANSNPK